MSSFEIGNPYVYMLKVIGYNNVSIEQPNANPSSGSYVGTGVSLIDLAND